MTKRTKQKIVTFAMVICVLALGAAGTLAYFADQTEYVENTFTIGNVEIELYESQFHRVNAGATTAGRLSHDTEDYPMNGAAGTASTRGPEGMLADDSHGWTGAFYTDEQILADAETYLTPKTGYLAVAGKNMAPGSNVMKCPYVKNVGANDAYVRVRVLIPAVLDNGILSSSMYTGTALSSGAATMKVTEGKTVNGKVYNEYAFTYTDPLVKDQLTFWNCWGDIKINDNTTNEQIQALIKSGDLVKDSTGAISFGVLVQADAIQADNFADATAAMAAFDAQTAAGH